MSEEILDLSPRCPDCGADIITERRPRTVRQAEILRYVIEFEKRRGCYPSYGQIARHLNLRSRATVAKHIHSLKRQGFFNAA